MALRLKQYNYILDHFAEYQKEQYQRRVDRERRLEASTLYSSGVRVECPYCHSKNTRKISGASKAGNVALFGVFAAGKVSSNGIVIRVTRIFDLPFVKR